ncbi:MAG: hypothetical protein DCC56_06005 [Anaerolineae bacterium]|nr:hypothetical protein [Anaerolineales bacterium]RIK31733.1 MAG: hypothetical protein DCC56_06005 [Anaerolineae bacterium]WKZ43593.1 MAG: hypothetical protein QY302_15975 [Anaerolineales bacterium]WKZ46353.1 MAG: hypothetical protein QY306_11095 [Anaerolineales bacterium]
MTKKHASKLIHVDEYVAEVDVELIYTDDEWSPYLSVNDALKLDDVREALRQKDFQTAIKLARVYKLSPLAV